MDRALKVIFIVIGAVVVFFVVLMGIGLWATSSIAGIAEDQIALISQGKIEEAYNKYSSKDFKEATNLEDFKVFVESNKILAESVDVSFPSREITNDVGTLEVKLEGKDGSITDLDYTLVKEEEEWKIFSMEFQEGEFDEGTEDFKVSMISEIAMADTTDENGEVAPENTVTTFSPDTEAIYVSVYLENPGSNVAVSSWLQYPETGDELGPVSIVTTDEEYQVAMFTFSKPDAGWMVGDYIFKVKAGTEEERIVEFKVE